MSQSNRLSFVVRMLPIVVVLAVIVVTIPSPHQGAPTENVKHSGSALASKRLVKEFREVQESDSVKNGVFTVELVDDNIFEWHVKLHKVDPDRELHDDLLKWKERTGKDHILLHLTYNDQYPISPPFVRVVDPNLIGGSMFGNGVICSQLLTENGWSSSYTIEPLILQLSATLSAGRARISALYSNEEFTYEQARQSFESLSRIKKWTLPDNS